jgi:hypothetical protein
MIKDTYQMAYELNCEELCFLKIDKDREHLRSKMMSKIIDNKCNC